MRRSPSRGQRSRNDQNLYNLSNLLKRMRSQQVSRGRCSNDKRYSSFGNSSISPTVSRPIIPSLPTTIKHPAVVQRFHMNYLPMMQLHPKDVLPSRQPTFNPTFQSNLLFPLGDLRNYRQSRHSVQEDFERRRHGSGNFILQRQRPEKQNFNNTAYCFAYFTIIIVGTKRIVIGGWGGGAFQINYNWDEKPCAPGIDGKHICERNYTDRLPHTIKCIETFENSGFQENSGFHPVTLRPLEISPESGIRVPGFQEG
ncbi:unnamed protein product [Didymodactylos carnosus]|uniref:Uncharacterized protein n=1 Tax=Didymodactylos carnosus TaxID=1234261 RepID=A0A814G4R8_9BILA|nr:unnamed protein product [Didymodactylos carnosus]CAF3763597.1 unnamed protein product [Didymodactylos carnosus]